MKNCDKFSRKIKKTVGQIIFNPEKMKENLAAIDFKLEESDYDLISSLDKQFRFCDGIGIYGIDIFA